MQMPTHEQGGHKVEERELRVRHRTAAGDERHKRANDRHELTEHDCLAAVLLKKRMGLHQVPAIH